MFEVHILKTWSLHSSLQIGDSNSEGYKLVEWQGIGMGLAVLSGLALFSVVEKD